MREPRPGCGGRQRRPRCGDGTVDEDVNAGHIAVDGVSYLDPETSIFEAMLSGWDRQQRVRAVKPQVISNRGRFRALRRAGVQSVPAAVDFRGGRGVLLAAGDRCGGGPADNLAVELGDPALPGQPLRVQVLAAGDLCLEGRDAGGHASA